GGSHRELGPGGRNHGLLAHEHPRIRDRDLRTERVDAGPVQGRRHRNERIADPVPPDPGERASGRTRARYDSAANHDHVPIDVYLPAAGGLPPRPPAEGSPLVSGTLVPIHLAAILFGIAAAVEALLFVWTRRNESGAMDDGKPVDHTARSPPQRT